MPAAPGRRLAEPVLRLVTAGGLAIDAYVHADLAGTYDAVGRSLTEGTLFRIEAGLAALAALVVVISGLRIAYLFAFLVAGGGLAALLLYRYVNVGAIGPIPQMYEPLWFHDKTVAAIAEAIATVTALGGALLPRRTSVG